ncbi:MAG: KilA-N domain-containing protein [Campylobacterota bacterium]|nr:KilA-N domain-containing protein [Campylobacterota bacterium]
MAKIKVLDLEISVVQDEYISLTDIANSKDGESRAADIIKNWMRNRGTLEFIGTWEQIHNVDFKVDKFDHFKMQAGLTSFVLSPGKWIEQTNAIGTVVKSGRYGGTYAHKDIAFEFASAINPIFKLYLIKEFQRLKEEEQKQLGWDIKRNLTKINYRIHTDAIKENLIPKQLVPAQISYVYASEANSDLKGNIRDYADVYQLVCLANLESLNAHFINENIPQEQRIKKLNEVAIKQMSILLSDDNIKKLESK